MSKKQDSNIKTKIWQNLYFQSVKCQSTSRVTKEKTICFCEPYHENPVNRKAQQVDKAPSNMP